MSEPFAQPINAATRLCAVYGHPIRHSASPAMQNAGIAALGLNWRYAAFDVRPEELRTALAGAKAMQFVGLNLTVPHKLLGLDMMDALDDSARTWRAVNTVRFEGRDKSGTWLPIWQFEGEPPEKVRMQGFNTDADAVVQALRVDLGLELRDARLLLIGVGGVGGVTALRLASENVAELFLIDVVQSKAATIAAEIRRRYPRVRIEIGYPRGEVDLAINATPLGLAANDPLPVEGRQFSLRQARAVFDMIYRPAETPFLSAAKAAGCRTANGLGMLLYQGAKALEIWSGKSAPVEIMREALKNNVYGS